MNPKQRRIYFTQLWPSACAAQGWDRSDEAHRRAATLHATGSDSTKKLAQYQITALFAYLRHLAGDERGTLVWNQINRTSARAVNLQRQGSYFREKAGYRSGGRADFQRFKKMGDGILEPDMTEREASSYAMTMRARARKNYGTNIASTSN